MPTKPNNAPPPDLLSEAFSRLTPNHADALSGLARDMAEPGRFYHTLDHVRAVLACLFAWTQNAPSRSLLAAALYHDAVYDATRKDNEVLSAVRCHEALQKFGLPLDEIIPATAMILSTTTHAFRQGFPEETLLLDADLFILGSDPESYADYARAIRAEYAHVLEDAWRTGRRAVLERFLQRERIYAGPWEGREAREQQARTNLKNEIAALAMATATEQNG